MRSFAEMLLRAAQGLSLDETLLLWESEESGGSSVGWLRDAMASRLADMERSVREAEEAHCRGRLIGDDGSLIGLYRERAAEPLSGPLVLRACQIALSVATYNAAMGRIVAAPTAGSCGILPGLLFGYEEVFGADRERLLGALIVAGGVGEIVARRATLAGAEGGCQAECGAAGAMGTAALVFLRGGSAEACVHGAALLLKSVLGLICDPVAGLVEVPCVKRNGLLTGLAVLAADMALAGVRSVIPPDEVIDAMGAVGRALPEAFRETARGGLAATPTGCSLRKALVGEVPPLDAEEVQLP